MRVAVTINGERREADVEPRLLLVHLIREVFRLTGTHIGCDTSHCGACTVLLDGRPVKSCTVFAVQADGRTVLTVEGLMRHLYPLNAMGIAMGLHVRVGQEDNLYGRRGERATSVQQIEKMVRISEELWRPIATAEQAREIYQLGTFYSSIDETLERNGWLPNRKPSAIARLEAA